jgi:cytosine/adenosine deaminase-related metal-dependent hydrolase
VLSNNHKLATAIFGERFGALDAGCPADLIVLDYQAPTPLTSENLASHLAFSMCSASVESVMANGKFIIRNRQCAFEDRYLYDQARIATEKLWKKLQTR